MNNRGAMSEAEIKLEDVIARGVQLATDTTRPIITIYAHDGPPGMTLSIEEWRALLSAAEEALALREKVETWAKRWSDERDRADNNQADLDDARAELAALRERLREADAVQGSVPDFGMLQTEVHGITLECRAIAPGISMQDLVHAYSQASEATEPGDQYSGNATKWPVYRGVKAVADMILDAVYAARRSPAAREG